MFWDTHVHTHFSGDSKAALADMAEAALRLNLDGLCFTDHYDYDYPGEPELFLLDFDRYRQETAALRQMYDGRLPIGFGIELGLQPHLAEHNRKIARSYPFDFVIGSSHVVHGNDPYYPSYFEGRAEAAAYREYFESILENIKSFTDFDVYGHLDYVVRYGPKKNAAYSYEKYSDIIDEILRALIAGGKGIEVNTGGFAKGLGHPHPTEAVLARYRELGGEILTVGSDAHIPQHVGAEFARLPDILRNAGFSYYTVFEKRKPHFLPLP